MKEQLLSFIENIRADKRIDSFDEAATKQGIILPLLSNLGWNIFNIDEVKPEQEAGEGNVDYALRLNNKDKIFIEVKRVNEDLEKHQEQLLDYSFKKGVWLAILTNGVSWWFYLPLYEGSWYERKFYTIDMLQQEPDDIATKFIDFLSKENINNEKAILNAESVYRGQQKRKILRETLHKAWNKIITEPDELLMDLINDTTEKLCGYKADSELIEQFLLTNRGQFLLSEIQLPKPPLEKKKPLIKSEAPGDYIGKSIMGFYFKNKKYEVRSWHDLLMELSSLIYSLHRNEFERALELRGTKRPYFTRNKNELRIPEKISNSNIFVEVNLNANNIVKICYDLLAIFGYSQRDLQIEAH
ncbi:MAG TPA: type I restriction endonuclease [Candidatus Brocadiia bacterium]|nr:restriction endonuclease subunit R [Planctomycetota bacterium]MDO8093557.1 hypothetical protein [Candidatus Brocadiales bacterium]